MTFTNDTIVQECLDADMSIPQTKYDFMSIERIGHIETGTFVGMNNEDFLIIIYVLNLKNFVDVIGVCKSASELLIFTARTTGKDMKRREVTLVDQSNSAVGISLVHEITTLTLITMQLNTSNNHTY